MNTILGAWVANLSASAGSSTPWYQQIDPVQAAVILGIFLLILAAIPYTSKLALYLSFTILILLVITARPGASST